ncbi:MAG: hypothetical protein JW909_11310 [Planctomycetes bacterium]|nr:hypothetical protein [Planctomycetota bacterium]
MSYVTSTSAAAFLCLFACGAASGAAAVSPGEAERAFVLANEAYRKAFVSGTGQTRSRMLQEAVAGYNVVLDAYPSAEVYHNLGNALFRLGRKGQSIAAYRRSLILAGSHPDTVANLEYVRSTCTGTPEPPAPGPVVKALFFWYFGASLNTLETSALLSLLAASTLICICIWRGRRWLAPTIALLLLAVVIGGAYLQRRHEWIRPHCAVVVSDTRALSEARPTATPLFVLGEGSETLSGREREGWREVLLPDGRRGWVASQTLSR